MARGAWKGILKDDVDLSGCTIKDGQQVRLRACGAFVGDLQGTSSSACYAYT